MTMKWMFHQTILPRNERLNLHLHWYKHDNVTGYVSITNFTETHLCKQAKPYDVRVVIKVQVMYVKPHHKRGFTSFVLNDVAHSIVCFYVYLLLTYQICHNLQPLSTGQVCIRLDHLAILSVGWQLWCSTFLILVLSLPLAILQRFLGSDKRETWGVLAIHSWAEGFLKRLSAKINGELLNLNRNQLIIMKELLRGHYNLKLSLFKLWPVDSPGCDRCKYSYEAVSHIFLWL